MLRRVNTCYRRFNISVKNGQSLFYRFLFDKLGFVGLFALPIWLIVGDVDSASRFQFFRTLVSGCRGRQPLQIGYIYKSQRSSDTLRFAFCALHSVRQTQIYKTKSSMVNPQSFILHLKYSVSEGGHNKARNQHAQSDYRQGFFHSYIKKCSH